jgi:hypothetical protein
MTDVAPGDRVTVGVTHQVRIDGKDAWIKVEFNSAVQDGEDAKAASTRTGKAVAENVIREIERQGGVMADANAAQRNR